MKLIEYDSKMNGLSFGKFKEKELDLFFSICYKMQKQGTKKVILSFEELKELSASKRTDRFIIDLKNVYKKLLNITMEIETEREIQGFVLFTDYVISKDKREISISINENYSYVLNDINKFTKFDLLEFVSLRSAYAKNMFKLLKQFDKEDKKENWYLIKIEDFKERLGVSKSYTMGDLDKRVLTPVLEQLKPIFKNLKIEKIKKGVKVKSLKFTWAKKKEKRTPLIEDVIIVEENPIKRKSSLGEKDYKELVPSVETELDRKKHELLLKIRQNPFIKDPFPLYFKLGGLNTIKECEEFEEMLNNKEIGTGVLARDISTKKDAGAGDTPIKNPTETAVAKEVGERGNPLENVPAEATPTKETYTEEDIDEKLLVSKKGRKLGGAAKKNKIEKILLELNKEILITGKNCVAKDVNFYDKVELYKYLKK